MSYSSYFLGSARRVCFSTLNQVTLNFTVKDGYVYLESASEINEYCARMPANENMCKGSGCVSESFDIVHARKICMECGTKHGANNAVIA